MGVHKKTMYRGELPKKRGLDSLQIQGGGLGEKEGSGAFEGGLIPLHTVEVKEMH